MAFKRSAVRSRLSPPKSPDFFRNQDFFLCISSIFSALFLNRASPVPTGTVLPGSLPRILLPQRREPPSLSEPRLFPQKFSNHLDIAFRRSLMTQYIQIPATCQFPLQVLFLHSFHLPPQLYRICQECGSHTSSC